MVLLSALHIIEMNKTGRPVLLGYVLLGSLNKQRETTSLVVHLCLKYYMHEKLKEKTSVHDHQKKSYTFFLKLHCYLNHFPKVKPSFAAGTVFQV